VRAVERDGRSESIFLELCEFERLTISVDGQEDEDEDEEEGEGDDSDEEMDEDKDGDVDMDDKPKAHDPNDLSAFKMDEYDNEESTGICESASVKRPDEAK
jgi:periodic tryptophan protein 1